MTIYANSVAELSATCATCGAVHSVIVDEADFSRYTAGALVQEAFPELPIAGREVVIGWRSGYFTCVACWATMADE